MILIPKNWDTFQHYKDRSPAWIKLHRSMLDDYEFSCLPVASRALAPLLWLLASEYEGGKITASVEKLAFRLRMTPKEFTTAVKPLIDGNFFSDASNTLAPRKHDASLEKEREKQEQTEKEKISCGVGKPTPTTDDDFEKLWSVYPKRKGPADKGDARKAYGKARLSGASSEVLLLAAQAYASQMRETGKLNTEYVKQCATWLNKRSWEDYSAPPPTQTNQFAEDLAIIRRQIAEATSGKTETADSGRERPNNVEELWPAGAVARR